MKNIHAKVSDGLLEQFYIKSSIRIYEKLGNHYLPNFYCPPPPPQKKKSVHAYTRRLMVSPTW